jgi:hypothetical protein
MMYFGVPTTTFVFGLERFLVAVTVHGRIKAPIPKHNCAIVGVPLGFHYGHAKEHETRGDCR